MAVVPKLELPTLLATLSDQLREADRNARARGNPIMQLEECEIELSVSLELGAKGSVKFWVLEAGADAKTAHTNKVRVKLKPIDGTVLQAFQASLDRSAPTIIRERSRKTKQ